MGACTVVVTGASGSAYGMRLIEQLALAGHEVSVVFTEAGREVTAFELGFELPVDDAKLAAVSLAAFLELANADKLRVTYPDDLFDRIASGSHRNDAMVVCPCSMGTLAAIAHGLSDNLIERAADVMLKENRRLILVPRETPFSTLHLENMLTLSRMNAVILPANPGFYHRPQTIEGVVDFIVARILDQLDIEHALMARWGSDK